MGSNEEIIRAFAAAWSRLDAAELASYFAEDGVYHNMPFAPVAGRAKIEAFIAGFIKPWTATEWEVLNIVSAGDVVFAERIDRTKVGDKAANLPCCGVFELRGGKIQVWRDYFDMATYTKALA
jgi:limonene-1,2-epoxide hydrolase